MKVLIVEDDQKLRDLFIRFIQIRGCQVREARDGEEAVQVASRELFDLIVMDVKMPKLDGVSAFYEIRKANPAVPTILITGYRMTPELEMALREEYVEYLHKPFTLEQFMSVMDRVTGQQPGDHAQTPPAGAPPAGPVISA